MPVYEYECQSCHENIEVWQSIADEPLAVCPACKGDLKKLISMSSFQLKGGGWYADGYSTAGGSCKSSGCGAASSTPCCESSAAPCKSS
ncbi:MAG: zinc ribbon domain-containing protein [Proteobacteria bacterium]|nr:zinc ribbon domain-containing protein [Pseudomonadota bacterium]MBU1736556.1 zinc ribbon domain-containing protein [Pseudomonadota bacterium]